MAYGAHISVHKEWDFMWMEILEQIISGYIVVFTIITLEDLPRLYISPVDVISQTERRPRMSYEFLWSGKNSIVGASISLKAIYFDLYLCRVLYFILEADPLFWTVYLCKVNLLGSYMRIWDFL